MPGRILEETPEKIPKKVLRELLEELFEESLDQFLEKAWRDLICFKKFKTNCGGILVTIIGIRLFSNLSGIFCGGILEFPGNPCRSPGFPRSITKKI